MNQPAQRIHKPAIILGILIGFAIFSYVNFQNYTPKAIAQIQEVRGATTKYESLSLPYPQDAKELGVTKTSYGRQITLKINLSPEEAQTFYKNVLLSQDWKVESEGKADSFLSTNYKKLDQKVLITSSREDGSGSSIVGIDIQER